MDSKPTSLNYIRGRLINILRESSSAQDWAIVIDGQYFISEGKFVYVRLDRNSKETELEFFNKVTDKVKNQPVENALKKIKECLVVTNLYDIDVPGVPSIESASFISSPDMGLIIIESELYNKVKSLVLLNSKQYSIRFGGNTIDSELSYKLQDAFRKASFMVYKNLIYHKNSNRFIARLWKSKFYSIQRTFVPVFIRYDKIYNPLLDNKDLNIDKTALYKLAIEKNRLIEVGDLSCYMLTHKEICQALGMVHFVRFTPSFIYSLFVGLIQPNLTSFPNKNYKIYMKPRNLETRFKRMYSSFEFEMLVRDIQLERVNSESSDSNVKLDKDLRDLSSYLERDSLFYYCGTELDQLRSIGPNILDTRKNTGEISIYNYMSEAKLLSNYK